MPSREELLAKVKRKRLIDEVKAKRASQSDPDRAHASVLPIGTSIPVLGPLAKKAGEYTGAAMATVYPGGKFSDNLEKFQRQNAEDELRFAEENPVTATVSNIAGGMVLPPIAKAIKPFQAAGKLAQVGNFGTNLGVRAGEAAATGAADAELRGQDAGQAAKEAAAFTGILGGAGAAAKGLGKYIPRFVFGVKPETAAKYKARAPEINAASEEELVGDIENVYGRLKGDVTSAKDAANAAKIERAAAERIMAADLRNERPPSELPGEVQDIMRGMGREASEGSSKAFDVLKQHDGEIGVGPLKGYLTQNINKTKIGEAIPDTPEIRTLAKYRDFLNETKLKAMRPEEAKQFVQMIDEDIADIYAKQQLGQRLTAGDKALISYRRFVDSHLKEIKPYAEAMAPVAQTTQLLNEARDIFSDEKRTFRLLRNLNAPENAKDRAVLEALGKRTGKDLIGQLGKYEEAQGALRDPAELARRRGALPESQAAARAEEELGDRQLWLEPAKGINPQSAVRRVTSDVRPDFKNQERLRYLGEIGGDNFLQRADDLGVQRALNQGFTRGSRNTNLGAFSVGGVLGKIFKGDPAAAQVGQGVGAMLGAAADLAGPQTYKAMLDFSMSPRFPQYRAALQDAARRGPNAFIAITNSIGRQDPEFQAYATGRAEEP